MERYAWHGRIVPGSRDEYIRRHDNIWPEMKEVLEKAGIRNYSIWMQGEELFGYYECEQGIEYAGKVQAESEVVKKWDAYMKDILIMDKDPVTGAQPLLEQVFRFRQDEN
jgi:L-rhamnose mutarotase